MSTRQESVGEKKGSTTLHVATPPKQEVTPKSEPTLKPAFAGKIQMVKKISPKTLFGTVEKFPKEPKRLFTILGIAHAIKTGNSQFGDWLGFVGSFEAMRIDTGERFVAGTAFVPDVVTSLLSSALAVAQEKDITASIRFALEVGIKPDEKSVTGYVYTVVPLVQLSENDALAELRQEISSVPQISMQS